MGPIDDDARTVGFRLVAMKELFGEVPGWDWRSWTVAEHIAFDDQADRQPPLVIISCGSRKASSREIASELYTGSYFALALRAARSLVPADRIRVLSAKHGLVPLWRQLDPYDLRLGHAGSVTDTTVKAQAKAQFITDVDDVMVLAGRDYRDLAAAVWPHARSPFLGTRGNGDQQKILAAIAADRHDRRWRE
jgi:hypothetical protein